MASDTLTTDTLVRTTAGVVRGRRVGDLVAWRGIPYAAPPVGPLRLRAPQPVTPWSGELDATEFGDAAVQHKKFTALRPGKYQPSSENCLTLNVLATPGTSGTRPVMVFIHGGAYTLGMSATALYGGQSLVRRGDIVYVSINYRLGSLGYLDLTQFSTPERPFDSNLGLRDQVAALEWVQRNIAEFGGDPDNVTVFGESAGANAVTTLMTTPAAKGLFARAISESSAPGLVTTADRAARWASDYVTLLGAEPDTAAEALTSSPVGALGRAGNRLGARVLSETPGLHPFGPVIDGDFLPKPPLDAFADGSAHRVPLIIGTNAREGTLFPKLLDALPTDPDRIGRMFALTDPGAEARVTAAYPGYPAPDAAVDLGGDLTFWRPSIELAEAHSAFAPTFSYRFDFAPRAMKWLGLDATHGFELFAVFDIADTLIGRGLTLPGGRRGLKDVTDTVQRHWLRFASQGTPLASWPKYDTDRRATLVFDTVTTVQDDPRRERRLAWEGYRGYYGQGL
ncbi:carboxylesterase/lipase family protein [Rhodococcus sp. 21391]|uniref:carboxylesterase/lipase family protein n=1 Tax=Rhodococcus sp. 21391 TaxID=2683591 RepID=UPI00192CD5E9|nr:carboxylesterase/lipase family protein [Rhodococcus sp. 21391]QQZ12457.1 carboxylesterase/lipase family protein [Rhodococcus sp. 21391]